VRIDGELMEIWPNEVCDNLVTTLRVEPASVPILSFKLKGLRSRLGSQRVRVRKKELIEVLPMQKQS